MSEVCTLFHMILVMPATNAASEHSQKSKNVAEIDNDSKKTEQPHGSARAQRSSRSIIAN